VVDAVQHEDLHFAGTYNGIVRSRINAAVSGRTLRP
jgi:hypothetical protein